MRDSEKVFSWFFLLALHATPDSFELVYWDTDGSVWMLVMSEETLL